MVEGLEERMVRAVVDQVMEWKWSVNSVEYDALPRGGDFNATTFFSKANICQVQLNERQEECVRR